METGKRKEWIDAIRAIGVLFIIWVFSFCTKCGDEKMPITLLESLPVAIIKLVYVCIGCGLLLSILVNKYLTEIIGKRRKHRA